MLSTSQIILQYVCPAAGMVTGNLMWTAPLRAVHKATKDGQLGDLNPTPWAVMLGNCVGWIIYSFLIGNLFVFFANVFGFLLSVWLNLQAIKLQYGDFRSTEVKRSIVVALEEESRRSFIAPLSSGRTEDEESPSLGIEEEKGASHSANNATDSIIDFARVVWNVTSQNAKAPVAHERIVLFIVTIWLTVISVISYGGDVIPLSTRKFAVGIIVNLNLVFFYGAPLSTIFQVLRTQNSSSIHIPTMITNTVNGIFWCAFGIASMDLFIAVPNALGAILGGVQGFLCVIFPRRPSSARSIPNELALDNRRRPPQETVIDDEVEKAVTIPVADTNSSAETDTKLKENEMIVSAGEPSNSLHDT